MNYQSFKDLWEEVEKDDAFHEHTAILDFAIELNRLMKHRHLSKKEVAEKLGVSQAYVTKVFRGNVNFTIGTMVRLARALNGKLTLHVTPEEEKNVTWVRVLNKPKQAAPTSWCTLLQEESICKEGAIG